MIGEHKRHFHDSFTTKNNNNDSYILLLNVPLHNILVKNICTDQFLTNLVSAIREKTPSIDFL
jgi:hypothetical protein